MAACPSHGTGDCACTGGYFFQDVPVVLSATRLSQPVSESPASITVIDREMIEASGAIEIPDLFKLVPGFQVGHANNSTNGPITTVTYHGLTDRYARHMQVLVDGRSVYAALRRRAMGRPAAGDRGYRTHRGHSRP